MLPGGGGEGGGERAEASGHLHGRARGIAVSGRGVEQEVGGGAGRPGPREQAVDPAPADHGAQDLGREPLGGEVRHRHRGPAQEALRVLAPQPAEGEPEADEREDRALQRLVDVGGREGQEAREVGGDGGQDPVELRVAVRVLRGHPAQLEGGAAHVSPQGEAAALRHGREQPRLGLDEAQPTVAQVEVLDHGGAQGTEEVGDGRGLEPGMELLRDRRPAQDLAALEHEGGESSAGEQGRRHQPVVPAPDDDDVRLHATLPFFQSFKSSRAAMRPGAPMIPPPGWVAEPHM